MFYRKLLLYLYCIGPFDLWKKITEINNFIDPTVNYIPVTWLFYSPLIFFKSIWKFQINMNCSSWDKAWSVNYMFWSVNYHPSRWETSNLAKRCHLLLCTIVPSFKSPPGIYFCEWQIFLQFRRSLVEIHENNIWKFLWQTFSLKPYSGWTFLCTLNRWEVNLAPA